MDVWRLDFSVHNGTGSWLDHLIARFGIASEWPDCTNWSGPDVFRLREINPSVPLIDMTVDWTDTAGHIQRSGRNVVAPGATLTDTEFIIKLRRDPAPRFVNWSVDYRLGSASTTGADARLDPRAVEAALGLDRPTRRLIQERLLAAGFDPGVADGLFGPVTRSVIRRWQAARGVAATGYLDSAGAAQLRAAVEGAGREVQRQFAPVADAERQAARRRTLRRLAQVLEGGTHRVEAVPRRELNSRRTPRGARTPRNGLRRQCVPGQTGHSRQRWQQQRRLRRRAPRRRAPGSADSRLTPRRTSWCAITRTGCRSRRGMRALRVRRPAASC